MEINGTFGIALGLVLAQTITTTPASAAPTFGSAAILTNRTCLDTPSQICTLGPRIFTKYAGGIGTTFTTSAENMNGLGASAAAATSFDTGYLPTIKVGSEAGATTRTGATATAFRTYTYTGDRTINLALLGNLHFITSGSAVQGDGNGQGNLNVILNVLPVSALSVFSEASDAVDIISNPITGADCSSGAIAAGGFNSVGLGSGEYSQPVSLSQACAGGAITINPGDSFVVLATLQAISNRGGLIDAMHTFSVVYDAARTVYADNGESVGATFLENAIVSPIPEPATWAMMLGGFGLVGAAARRGMRLRVTY